MRRSRFWWSFAALALSLGVALASVAGLRWRARLIGFKAAGKIPDLGWRELIRYLPPGRPITLRAVAETRNPYLSIHPADTSAEAVAAGREVYRRLCVSCHGIDGSGPTGPARLNAALPHGSSDWALYRAISRGLPGTGMPSFTLRAREYWQVVTYVQNLRREPPAGPEAPGAPLLSQLSPVSQETLVDARRDSANWLTYSGAYDGRRYSNLSQINRDNVPRLRLLWMHQIGGSERFETTPLVKDGVLFLTTPDYGVRALDAQSGTLLWAYQRTFPPKMTFCCGTVNRGLAMLGSTLYLATLDARLLALDARTGKRLWDVAAADPAAGYSFTSAPLAARGLVLIGSAGGEYASRGFIDAYDAESGTRRWRFYTIPEPGTPGNETWSGDSWRTGGGAPWLTGSYDPALDLVYWGVGNPNPDYNGERRLGDNLYTNSVVALERATGKLRWHFQFTPHDEHDWDSAQIPVLADPPGSPPLLLWANRNGFYYVLNRATGGFLQGRAFARQTWAAGLDSNGRPIVRPESAPTIQGTAVYPAVEGATNWWSPSYSPRTGSFYVSTFERMDLVFKGPADESGGPRLGGARQAVRPGEGRGAIRALDALSGARRWEFGTFTTTEEFLSHVGGLLSTAGDLLFGAKEDQVLALDATNGRLLWTFKAGGGVHAAPITYLVGGRQQLTVAAGQALLTFGLP